MLDKGYPDKVKVFFGFIFGDKELFDKAREDIVSLYGDVDIDSGIIDFTFTDYYQNEMGRGLKRAFLSLSALYDPVSIVSIKNKAIELERKYAAGGKRKVNIDPGYLTSAKVVLSTTKDFSHRIYLSDGIFAEVTLLFYDGGWQDLPWTFPDYRTKAYKRYFMLLKETYREQLKHV